MLNLTHHIQLKKKIRDERIQNVDYKKMEMKVPQHLPLVREGRAAGQSHISPDLLAFN